MRSPEIALNSPKRISRSSSSIPASASGHAVSRSGGGRWPGEHGDPRVPQADQVVGQGACAGQRIAADAVDIPADDLAVDHHGGRAVAA
jgi:hypothetical protein